MIRVLWTRRDPGSFCIKREAPEGKQKMKVTMDELRDLYEQIEPLFRGEDEALEERPCVLRVPADRIIPTEDGRAAWVDLGTVGDFIRLLMAGLGAPEGKMAGMDMEPLVKDRRPPTIHRSDLPGMRECDLCGRDFSEDEGYWVCGSCWEEASLEEEFADE